MTPQMLSSLETNLEINHTTRMTVDEISKAVVKYLRGRRNVHLDLKKLWQAQKPAEMSIDRWCVRYKELKDLAGVDDPEVTPEIVDAARFAMTLKSEPAVMNKVFKIRI